MDYPLERKKRKLERLVSRYNPENDYREGPPVTVLELELLTTTLELIDRIEELKKELEEKKTKVPPVSWLVWVGLVVIITASLLK